MSHLLCRSINEENRKMARSSSVAKKIVSALEKIHLTLKFRGSEIIQLQNYRTAAFEDIADEHSTTYISPLRKAKYPVSKEGVDGSRDTHTTDTIFKESLFSAGACISLVDYVVDLAKITHNAPIGFALITMLHMATILPMGSITEVKLFYTN